ILDTYESIDWKEDYILYLTAKPETILRRIIQRGSLEKIRRDWNEEDKTYLIKILSSYKQFLSTQSNVFIIDTNNLTPENVIEEFKKFITDISDYSFTKIKQYSTTQMNIVKFLK
ncbi:MAG: deoxynucleoside kinase, partial [Promethearchaeota archaeon]